MKDNFNILVNKLNKFRRRYYIFKLLRGILITLIFFLITYLIVSVVEYFAYLPSNIRIIEFYLLIIFFALLLTVYVFFPVFQLLRITKQLSYSKLNSIIVNHFPDIKDKLLNILELANTKELGYSEDILWASIDQKINEIKIFDIKKAISFKHLRYFLGYFILSLVVLVSLALYEAPVLKESNYRIVNYKETFSKPAPYVFILRNNDLEIPKGENVSILVQCKGDELPGIIYINIEGNNYIMKDNGNGLFEYTIESCINSFSFYFTDLRFSSKTFSLNTLPKPNINYFLISAIPPGYTGLPEKEFNNVGDLKVPIGTNIEWKFNCIDTDSLFIDFGNNRIQKAVKNEEFFNAKERLFKNKEYSIVLGNKNITKQDIITYSILVIEDLYPTIEVVQSRDTFNYSKFYFKGIITDDYGFSALNFHFNIENIDSIIPLQLVKSLNDQDFYFTFDFNQINTSSNEINYYFSVVDNDRINDYKTTTSESFLFKIPSQEEIDSQEKEQFKNIENLVIKSNNLANEIREDLKNLQLKNLNSNTTDWEKSQLVNDIMNKKRELEELFNKAKKNNQELDNFMNSYNEQSSEILKKQEELDQLLDEIFTDELKKLMEEFAELAEEFNNDKMNQLSEELDMSLEDLSEQLDRNLEMLKKMKVEQKLQSIIDNMYKLSTDEQTLAKELNEEKNYVNIHNKNVENSAELNRLQQKLNETLELNKELKKPINFDDFDIEFEEIKDGMNKANNELQKKNRKKGSRELQNTSEQLKSLAFNMDQMLQLNTKQQNMENIENLQQILSNLLVLSFSQEDILNELKNIQPKDPKLNQLNRQQNNLLQESVVIKDSLYALANRTPQITSVINNELLNLELNLNKAANVLEEGLLANARGRQQFAITAANNLALLLSDILKQIEEQMANAMPGDQQCENPNGGKKGSNMDMLKQSSEGMKQQLQKMIEEMKKGKSGKMSKMLGESLMQHEMMQQMLREMMNNGSVGSEAKSQLQQIDKILERNRKELVNKNISAQTLMRQNQILTRLLEAEKAEMERDIENKRESETADEDFYSNPVKYFEYNEKKDISIENLQYKNNKLNNFYNKKYKQYLYNYEGQDGKQ